VHMSSGVTMTSQKAAFPRVVYEFGAGVIPSGTGRCHGSVQ
jgi:hypothetical protein